MPPESEPLGLPEPLDAPSWAAVLAGDLGDSLVNRVFSASLDLHSALSRLDEHHPAHGQVVAAIDRIDDVIRVVRQATLIAAPGTGNSRHTDARTSEDASA